MIEKEEEEKNSQKGEGEIISPGEQKTTYTSLLSIIINYIKQFINIKENFTEIYRQENFLYNFSQEKNIMELKTLQNNTLYKGQYQHKFDNNKNNFSTLPNGYGIFYEKDKKKYSKIEEVRNKKIKKNTQIQYDNKGEKIEEGEYSTDNLLQHNQSRNGVIMIYKKNNENNVKYFLDKFKKEDIKNKDEEKISNKEIEIENIDEAEDTINNVSNKEQTPIIEGNFYCGFKEGYIKEKYNNLLFEYICNNDKEQIIRVTKNPDDVDKKNIYFLLDKNFVKKVCESYNNENCKDNNNEDCGDNNNILDNIKEDDRCRLKKQLHDYYDNDNNIVCKNYNYNIVCKNYNNNINDYNNNYYAINSQKNPVLYGTLNKIINGAATSYEQQKKKYTKTAEEIKQEAQKIEETNISTEQSDQKTLKEKYEQQQKQEKEKKERNLLLLERGEKGNQNNDNNNEDNKDFFNNNEDNKDFLSNALEKTFGFFSDLFSGEYDIIDNTINFCKNLITTSNCNNCCNFLSDDNTNEINNNYNKNNNSLEEKESELEEKESELEEKENNFQKNSSNQSSKFINYSLLEEENNKKGNINNHNNNESKINLNIETYEQQKTNSIH